jgi:hypothetical protein
MPTEEKIYITLVGGSTAAQFIQGERLCLQPILNSSLPKCLEACLVENQLWKMGFYF